MRKIWVAVETEEAQPTWVKTKEPSLAQKQAAVGGLIEYAVITGEHEFPVPLNGDAFMGRVVDVIVHEEGLLVADPQLNILATIAAYGGIHPSGPLLFGDAIIVLEIDDDAEPISPEEIFSWKNAKSPKSENSLRQIEGFVPISSEQWKFPDFGADGEEPEEHAFPHLHDVTVDSMNDACQFYHAMILNEALVLDPTRGFLTDFGFSAYPNELTHTDANSLQRINTEAFAQLEKQGLDAWTICAQFVMVAELSLHLQENKKNIPRKDWPDEFVRQVGEITEGREVAIHPTVPEHMREEARASFILDRIGEWCSSREHIGSGASAALINHALLPLGWSDWIDEVVTVLGGTSGDINGDADELFQTMLDTHMMTEGDPDADDNDDDPFSEVGA